MLADLRAYYDKHGIGALNFACPLHSQCAVQSPRFTTAKEAYVGPEYQAGTLPRLLFLSLDSGSGDADPSTKTLEASRAWMRTAGFASFPKGRHWSETHELALQLLRPFKPGLTVEQVGPYFAHTNSAKCCQNNPGNAVASARLFENCRRFIPGELMILSPDILVTQGDFARDVANRAFDVEQRIPGPEGIKDCQLVVLRLTPTHRTLWFHSYHPSAYGLYWSQRNACWPLVVQTVTAFIAAQRAGRPWSPAASGSSAGRITTRPANAATPTAPPAAPRAISVGSEGPLETLVAAFNTVFRVGGRPFNTLHGEYQGVSDDAPGVQWNAGLDRDRGTAWLGVNLEGMAYDDWPIARLIERELARPTFPGLCATLPGAPVIELAWSRDAWQVAARLPMRERRIGGTPVTLDRLTPEGWKVMLTEACGCLDPSRGHRGRAQQVVTLKNGRAEKPVSPHLTLTHVLWRRTPWSQAEAEQVMRLGRRLMEPVYAFVRERSR